MDAHMGIQTRRSLLQAMTRRICRYQAIFSNKRCILSPNRRLCLSGLIECPVDMGYELIHLRDQDELRIFSIIKWWWTSACVFKRFRL